MDPGLHALLWNAESLSNLVLDRRERSDMSMPSSTRLMGPTMSSRAIAQQRMQSTTKESTGTKKESAALLVPYKSPC